MIWEMSMPFGNGTGRGWQADHPAAYGTLPRPGGSPEYLGEGYATPFGPVPPRRGFRRLLWMATAAATALILGAGGFTAYRLLTGSGPTLDIQVPADAVAYAEINLDPPAGQKLAALRFFRHLPDAKVREDSSDLVEGLVEPLADTPQDRRELAEDIKPWLGKHLAFAADPRGSRTEPIVIMETTDRAKAQAGLEALTRDGGAEFGYVVTGRVVVLARTRAAAQAAIDDAERGSLHGNDRFRLDIASVPSDGVLTAWFDLSRAASLSSAAGTDTGGGAVPSATAGLHGRIVAGLRFSDTTADLQIRGVGLNQLGAGGEAAGPRLATLPDDTVTALAVSGADKAIQQLYQRARQGGLTKALRPFEENARFVLPDDLVALVGSSTVVAVGGAAGRLDYGLISRTDDVDGARSAGARLLTAIGDGNPITVRPVPSGTVIADSSDYADKLATRGTLGNTEPFRTALPDLNVAQFAFYLDGKRLSEIAGRSPSGPAASFRALGFTAAWQGGTASMHLRLVVG
jgi:hypothetical protein